MYAGELRLITKPEIFFITAMGEGEDETKGFELGAVDFITKPFDANLIRDKVKQHLMAFKKD